MIAVWIPVLSVFGSDATVAIVKLAELSSVIRNWPDARVSRTMPVAAAAVGRTSVMRDASPTARSGRDRHR